MVGGLAAEEAGSALARERGVVIRRVRMVPETGELDRESLEECLGPRTRLLAIGAASNALGKSKSTPAPWMRRLCSRFATTAQDRHPRATGQA